MVLHVFYIFCCIFIQNNILNKKGTTLSNSKLCKLILKKKKCLTIKTVKMAAFILKNQRLCHRRRSLNGLKKNTSI